MRGWGVRVCRPDTCAFAPRVVCARPCLCCVAVGVPGFAVVCLPFPPIAIPICKVTLGLGVIGR
jgi:hypothetical protein